MERKKEILTLEDLKSDEWKGRWQDSIEQAKKSAVAVSRDTEDAEAQEALISFILNLGGVRRDVFEFLLQPHFKDTVSVASIRTLLCYAAPVEWMQLAAKALERDQVSGVLYVNEITEAYKSGIPVEEVRIFFERSHTAFEMCQYRVNCGREELPDKMTGSGREKLPDKMTGSEMGEIVADAVMTAMQKFMDERQQTTRFESRVDAQTDISRDVQEPSHQQPLHDSMMQHDREELPDKMTESDREELPDKMTESDREELPDKMTESEEEEQPELPDGTELVNTKSLVVELEEAQKQHGKRISFFKLLLNRHMKKMFLKLDEEAQISKIFEIMIGQKYEKGKILAIRRLMNGGMSNEFIFSLLEKDMSEEELTELCDTLLDDGGTGEGNQLTEKSQESEIPDREEEWR